MKQRKHKLFVYGTLMKEQGNALRLLPSDTNWEDATTVGGFTLYDNGIPYMASVGQGRVRGQVIEVDDLILTRLDQLEGHPTWYRRTPIQVMMGDDGHVETVMAYVYPHRPIPGEIVQDMGEGALWSKR